MTEVMDTMSESKQKEEIFNYVSYVEVTFYFTRIFDVACACGLSLTDLNTWTFESLKNIFVTL